MTVSQPLALCLTLSCLAMAGCAPLFPEALSTEADSVIDERLKGKWFASFEKSEPPCEIAFSANDRKKSLTLIDPSEPDIDPSEPEGAYTVLTTRIGKAHFMSLPYPDDAGDATSWCILRYNFVSQDEVHIFMMDERKLVEAIRADQLAGKLSRSTPGWLGRLLGAQPVDHVVKMTSNRAELRKYLTGHPDACFDLTEPFCILKRNPNAGVKSQNR